MNNFRNLSSMLVLALVFSGCNLFSSPSNQEEKPDDNTPQEETPKEILITSDEIIGIFTTDKEEGNDLFIFHEDNTGEYFSQYDNPNVGADTAYFNWQLDEYTGVVSCTCPDANYQFFTKSYSTVKKYETFNLSAKKSDTEEYKLVVSLDNEKWWYLSDLEERPYMYSHPTFVVATSNGTSKIKVTSFVEYFALFIDNYDNDNEIDIQFDVTWLKVREKINDGVRTSSGKTYTRLRYLIDCENNYGEERSATITMSKKSGEVHIYPLVQERITTMSMMGFDFTYNGQTYTGWQLNSNAASPACAAWVDNYDNKTIYVNTGASWCTYSKTILYDVPAGDGYRWRFDFSVTKNYSYNRMTTITFYKDNGESATQTLVQDGPLGEQSSGGGGSSGGGSSGGSSSDDTKGYTITRTSVCAIYALDNQSTGTKYSKSYYKWVSSSGRVILSISSSNSAYWIGVASKNYDSTCKGHIVSSYDYKFVDYSPVGGAWYYYFN
ncbi:MAG: hypothetical protein IJ776_06785 [Paludibacteraceae bacterium]|nr:hypothetical protein [Paludibacteraceae bacterium]